MMSQTNFIPTITTKTKGGGYDIKKKCGGVGTDRVPEVNTGVPL
jgi:hypothetical protein